MAKLEEKQAEMRARNQRPLEGEVVTHEPTKLHQRKRPTEMKEPQITVPMLKVMRALLTESNLSGANIDSLTGIGLGTVYPVLYRMEKAGWIVGRWERGDLKRVGQPFCCFYHLTELGTEKALSAFKEINGNW